MRAFFRPQFASSALALAFLVGCDPSPEVAEVADVEAAPEAGDEHRPAADDAPAPEAAPAAEEAPADEPAPPSLTPEQVARNAELEEWAGRPLPFGDVVVSLEEANPRVAARIAADIGGEVKHEVEPGVYWILLDLQGPEGVEAAQRAADSHPDVQFALAGWNTPDAPVQGETLR